MKGFCLFRKFIFLYMVIVYCNSLVGQHTAVEFKDFPLKKMDKLYPRHVAQAVKFLFDLWYWTSFFLEIESNLEVKKMLNESIFLPRYPLESYSSEEEMRACFKKLITPSLATLRPVKTFVNKIVAEWCKKSSQPEGMESELKEIILVPDTKLFEKLFSFDDHTLLRALIAFLQDGMANVPFGQEECMKMLAEQDRPYFKKFINRESLITYRKI